jgi:hypothetical protein
MIDSETAHPYGEAWRVQAYVTDEAITAMRALGATVDVVMDTARLDAQFENARAQIQDVPRDAPPQQSPAKDKDKDKDKDKEAPAKDKEAPAKDKDPPAKDEKTPAPKSPKGKGKGNG